MSELVSRADGRHTTFIQNFASLDGIFQGALSVRQLIEPALLHVALGALLMDGPKTHQHAGLTIISLVPDGMVLLGPTLSVIITYYLRHPRIHPANSSSLSPPSASRRKVTYFYSWLATRSPPLISRKGRAATSATRLLPSINGWLRAIP